ncbi:MAG: AraC family transcriptional regulator [Blastocatellia bacterium]|nr:AraC family transcriptional regulator [Blastocatellia bacterium]
MRSHFYIPPPPLSQFVGLLWYFEGHTPQHAKERVMPTGQVELVINLREDTLRTYDRDDPNQPQIYRGTLLSGLHSEYVVIDTSDQAEIMGVHFKPGGAFPFLPFPAGELRDTTVSLEDVWGREAPILREQLLAVPTVAAKFRLLEQTLERLAARQWTRHRAVAFALNRFLTDPGAQNIATVTNQIGLSSRRFIQLFTNEVGLTPKLFCRICRFQQVLRQLHFSRLVNWADVAAECGYFDQAHFIHDFRSFSGLNPVTYLAHRTEHLNHVPLIEP